MLSTVWILKKRTETEGVREHGAGESVWHQEGEVTGGWITLDNEEVHILYSKPYISTAMK